MGADIPDTPETRRAAKDAMENAMENKATGNRFTRWIARNMPTREQMAGNRWIRPVARHVTAPALWRFTRRSVPRGVALGILTGILVPMGQIPASAVLAAPLRANIPAAALTTFVTNPVTTPPLWLLAYWIGEHMLGDTRGTIVGGVARTWADWLVRDAGPATATGLVTLAVVGGVLAYVLTGLGWRFWVMRKWKRRSRMRAERARMTGNGATG